LQQHISSQEDKIQMLRHSGDSAQAFAGIVAENAIQVQHALEQRLEAQRREAQMSLNAQQVSANASDAEKAAMRQKFNDLFIELKHTFAAASHQN
jgi:hypothetical protein